MLVERKEYKNNDDSIGYIESIFDSGNILKTTYFPNNNRLYIAFKRGETYSYGNITHEMYNEFENAESHGKFFYTNIAKCPDKYPYRKEYTLYPSEVNQIIEVIDKNKDKDNDE